MSKAVEALQASLTDFMSELDFKVFRPAQVRVRLLLLGRLYKRALIAAWPEFHVWLPQALCSVLPLALALASPTCLLRLSQKAAFQCSVKCCDLKGPQADMQKWCVHLPRITV